MMVRLHTALDGTPDFDRSDLVESGVEPQSGATPHAGRGGEAKGNASSDIRVGVEELFVCSFRATDNEVSTAEIPFKSTAENCGFGCEVMCVVRNAAVGGDFARHGKLSESALVV